MNLIKSRKIRTPLVVLLLLGGCDNDDVHIETVKQELTTGFPKGLVCGMAYKGGSQSAGYFPVVDGQCNGTKTLSPGNPAASGFKNVSDGDRGAPAWTGFFHQGWLLSTLPNPFLTDELALPAGTACGFKETCNDDAKVLCETFDANISCPRGWVPRRAADLKAPAGCNFVWCEYQDPNHLYQGGPIPSGLTCGITDNDTNNGLCLGMRTASQGCPAGWSRFGFFDMGRPSGHGVGWCASP